MDLRLMFLKRASLTATEVEQVIHEFMEHINLKRTEYARKFITNAEHLELLFTEKHDRSLQHDCLFCTYENQLQLIHYEHHRLLKQFTVQLRKYRPA